MPEGQQEIERISLRGKIIITGSIKAVTGLHIGASETGIEIGGVDNVVIRNPINNQPYIPGSSLRGKMRSLLEKSLNKAQNWRIQTEPQKVRLHVCTDKGGQGQPYDPDPDYTKDKKLCPVCWIFGLPGELENVQPTRLAVRDSFLSKNIVDEENLTYQNIGAGKIETDMPYTEVKSENVIDRITSAAVPRQLERVPAGANFRFEMVYDIYNENLCTDLANLKQVFTAMNLLENSALGGSGSRGSGRVEFSEITIYWKTIAWYSNPTDIPPVNDEHQTVFAILNNYSCIEESIKNGTKGD